MTQLRDVEKHILMRKDTSLVGNPSVFQDASSSLSFGSQYFDQSRKHQNLKVVIETQARADSRAKVDELRVLKAEYLNLIAQYTPMVCSTKLKKRGRGRYQEVVEIHDRKQLLSFDPRVFSDDSSCSGLYSEEAHACSLLSVHLEFLLTPESARCIKCDLRRQADYLSINVYEWPLPTTESAAKSVVFELDVPPLLRHWRSTTYQILVDVLSISPPTPGKSGKSIILTEYPGLMDHLKSSPDRLQLGSLAKPVSQTQQGRQLVSDATEDSGNNIFPS